MVKPLDLPSLDGSGKSCANCTFHKLVQGPLWWRVALCCHPAAITDDGRAVTTCTESVFGLKQKLCGPTLQLFRARSVSTPQSDASNQETSFRLGFASVEATLRGYAAEPVAAPSRVITIKVTADCSEARAAIEEMSKLVTDLQEKLEALKEMSKLVTDLQEKLEALKENNDVQ